MYTRNVLSFMLSFEVLFAGLTELLATPVLHKSTEFHFPDLNQAAFVNTLDSYDVITPTRVTQHGHFVTHNLLHKIDTSQRRRRRDVTSSTEEDTLHYKVHVAGSPLHLRLEPSHGLFAPGLVTERYGTNVTNNHIKAVRENRCHFSGEIKEHPGSAAAIATCNGLHGLLRTPTGDYFIEPVRGHVRGDEDEHPHIVYKSTMFPHEDEKEEETQESSTGCGVDSMTAADEERDKWQKETKPVNSAAQHRHRSKRSISLERQVETLVVVDHMMMEYYRNEDIETYVLTIMNMVRIMYHDSTIGNAINIVLVRIMFLEKEESGLKITHHADNTLASFCKWQQTVNPKDEKHQNHHDVAILLTRKNICSRVNEPCSTLGLSQVSGMCQPHRSCSINEDTGLALAFTVAHEMGHNFGMQHDGVHNGCEPKRGEQQLVMAPQLNAEASPLVWSNCSKQAITRFLDRDWGYCLDDEPSEHEFEFPVLPPGVMYDVDHQCRLQYGPEAQYCEGIDELCMTLWCQVNNKCVTRLEAAAAGTLCGDNHWCFSGRCMPIGENPETIDGQWGEWASWSGCSRSCSAGVSYKERHCDNPPPSKGGKYCLGERKRYRICNTDKCQEELHSFREVQCEEFNSIPYKGTLYEWEPISTPATPCQLHCKPTKRFFSVMLKDMVVDGTSCRSGSRDMCISGKCRHVGCDWTIDSDAKEDRCGVCHGDGSTCHMIKEKFTEREGLGYVQAMVIPEGARNIRVEEVAEANNYLAVRNQQGHYFLNGHWFIQWSGDYNAAGTTIHYKRDGNRESFNAEGPLSESLEIMLLFQSENPGVSFEYTVSDANSTEKRIPVFHWKYMDWTHCTSSCGGGIQRSEVVCVEQEQGIVENHYCNKSSKRDDMQKSCNEHLCPARWWYGPWQHCSVTCGDDGIHKRTVICVRSRGPDEQVALEDFECEGFEKPAVAEPCHHKEPCPDIVAWKITAWSETCNGDPCAIQTREIMCSDENAICDAETKPEAKRLCSNSTCGEWHTDSWSSCTRSCGGGIRFRGVTCSAQACRIDTRPTSEQDCNPQPCPTSGSAAVGNQENDMRVDVPAENARRPKQPNYIPGKLVFGSDIIGEKDTTESEGTTSTKTTKITKSETKTTDKTSEQTTVRTTVPTTTLEPITEEPTPESTNSGITSKLHKWIPLFWEKCLKPCGESVMKRKLMCIETETMDEVAAHFCAGLRKPANSRPCQDNPVCLKWRTGTWSQCSTSCGDGVVSRELRCPESDRCDPDKHPAKQRPCNSGPCNNIKWVTGPWSQCTKTCGGGEQARHIQCVDRYTQRSTTGCNRYQKPRTQRPCNLDACQQNHAALNDGSSHCTTDVMSKPVCDALRRMGQCESQKYVRIKCCRTCMQKKHNKKSVTMVS